MAKKDEETKQVVDVVQPDPLVPHTPADFGGDPPETDPLVTEALGILREQDRQQGNVNPATLHTVPASEDPGPFRTEVQDPVEQESVSRKYARKYPIHYVNGAPKVLVARYRKQTPNGLATEHTYIGGPIADVHPLNLARIRAKLLTRMGEMVYLDPKQVDKIEFEEVPETPEPEKAAEQHAYEREAELYRQSQGGSW